MKYLIVILISFSISNCQDNSKLDQLVAQQENISSSIQDLKDKYQTSADACERCFDKIYGICADIGKAEVSQSCLQDPNKAAAYKECIKYCKRVLSNGK